MANKVYPKAKEKFLQALINMSTDTIKVALIDSADYTYDDAHEFLSDVTGAAVVGAPVALASKTFVGGEFMAADATLVSVSGDQSEALILYKDTGTPSTSALIAYLDAGFTGMPVTPNGGNIAIQWGVSGIFSL